MVQVPAGGRRVWSLLVITALVTALDQVTKSIVAHHLGPGRLNDEVEVLGTWLAISYVQNRGAAFGVLRGQAPMLVALAVVILIGVIVYFVRAGAGSRLLAVAVGLVSGGALGNLIDRVRLGYVVDFFAVGPWPTFNLADSAITVGVALIALHAVIGDTAPGRRGPSPILPAGPETNLPADN